MNLLPFSGDFPLFFQRLSIQPSPWQSLSPPSFSRCFTATVPRDLAAKLRIRVCAKVESAVAGGVRGLSVRVGRVGMGVVGQFSTGRLLFVFFCKYVLSG